MWKKISTSEFCHYCGEPGNYTSPRGKICCSSSQAKCPAVIGRRLETMSRIDENGQTGLQRRATKAMKTLSELGDDGLTGHQRKARKAAAHPKRNAKISAAMKSIMTSEEASRRSQIGVHKRSLDIVDGLNGNQRLARKARQTMSATVVDGRTLAEIAIEKAFNTMKTTVQENGLTILENRSRKIAQIINTPNDEGLTPIEVGRLKCLKMRRHRTGIPYQGKLEERFLDFMCAEQSDSWAAHNIKRGPTFEYVDPTSGKTRKYFSDFIIAGQHVVEVKALYWWKRYETTNKAKLEAVIKSGKQYSVFMDGVLVAGTTMLRGV